MTGDPETSSGLHDVRLSLFETFAMGLARSRIERTHDMGNLRAAVARNLHALVSTVALCSDEEAAEHPELARSIVNFGIPELNTIDPGGTERHEEIARRIARAIEQFEPRIVAASLWVQPTEATVRGIGRLEFHLEATIDARPYVVPATFTARLDESTGRLGLEDTDQ